MNIKHIKLGILLTFGTLTCCAQDQIGASIPWTTYEAEDMKTDGTILGPAYLPYKVETESSGQKCVSLRSNRQYIEFTASGKANSIVIRYSLPDSKSGGGTRTTFAIYKNNRLIKSYSVSSEYARLYGSYPFTNNPDAGRPRNFYDEIRMTGISILKGDIIRIQRDDQTTDDADYCIIDLVDLENIASPLEAPSNSISITDPQFSEQNIENDYTNALRKCIAKALETGKTVWIPSGVYKISGDILLPSNVTISGAGMWYSTLVGDPILYRNENRRVRLKGNGSNIHLADFAIIGKLDYRNDSEPNDGIVGTFGSNSTITNIWIEHTKVGMWVDNSKELLIKGCRLRNTIADGINFCVGVTQSTMENCTARGTGDDCFAIWPAVFDDQKYSPGQNKIVNCTAQLPFLANGAAIYGGKSNKLINCLFTDISQGSAILLSTTFQTDNIDKRVNNNFSGTTLVENCMVKYSGGFDHTWGWRAAVQICLDRHSISGIDIKNVTIENSLSDGLSVIAGNEDTCSLTNSDLLVLKITNYGLGVKNRHGLWIAKDVHGSLRLLESNISDIKNDSKNFIINKGS